MKQKLLILLMVVCVLTVCALPASAAGSHLVDEAGLLYKTESAEIESKLNEISTRQGMDVVIVTVDSTDGQTPMAYADDYYDNHGYGADGILLLVSMEDSDWWISTAGFGIKAFTDAGIEYLADQFVPYLSAEEYAIAFEIFVEQCDEFIAQAKQGNPYDAHNLPKEPFSFFRSLGVALIIGLVVAFIVTAVMKQKLKTVHMQAKADDYVVPGSLQISHSRDFHLYTHVDRRERVQSSSGSSTHTSSSGTSHGGGGGKF